MNKNIEIIKQSRVNAGIEKCNYINEKLIKRSQEYIWTKKNSQQTWK